MAIGCSSAICWLALVTSLASPALTHQNGEYYMVAGKSNRAAGRLSARDWYAASPPTASATALSMANSSSSLAS